LGCIYHNINNTAFFIQDFDEDEIAGKMSVWTDRNVEEEEDDEDYVDVDNKDSVEMV
jgi:hypothetical protein